MKHDLAYHLACPASPKYYQDDPAGTLKTCYTGTEMVLRHSRVYKAKVVVATTSGRNTNCFLSTLRNTNGLLGLNGQPAVYSQAESYHGNTNPYGPRACYDEGKRITESICYAFQFPPVPKPLLKSNLTLNNSQSVNGSSPEQSTRTYFPAVDIRIGRIFNTYGPHMPASDGRVVSTFIAAALKGEDLVIFGDGSARRVFQYVDDCIEGLLKLMDSNFWSPVNLAGQTEMSILELAHMIIRIVAQVKFDRGDFEGARVISRIVHGAQRIDDPPIRRPNICLAKEVLQYEAKTSMEVGLEKTILWMREELTKGPCRLLEE